MKRRIVAMLLAMMFVSCSILNIVVNVGLQKKWDTKISCYIGSEASVNLPLLSSLYPEIEWTAYTQSEQYSIMNDELPNRKADPSVLYYWGKPDQIMFLSILKGRLPHEKEYDACALDSNTAFALFNSTEPDGSSIRVNGKRIRVVGVIDINYPLILIPAESEVGLDYLAADNRNSLILLTSALGAELDSFELSCNELVKLLWITCILPWVFAAALLLLWIRRRGGWYRDASNAVLWLLFVSMVLLVMQCVPVRFLPSRWSDMSFYGQQVNAFSSRPFRSPNVYSKLLRQDVSQVLAWCAGACISLCLERMWLR